MLQHPTRLFSVWLSISIDFFWTLYEGFRSRLHMWHRLMLESFGYPIVCWDWMLILAFRPRPGQVLLELGSYSPIMLGMYYK